MNAEFWEQRCLHFDRDLNIYLVFKHPAALKSLWIPVMPSSSVVSKSECDQNYLESLLKSSSPNPRVSDSVSLKGSLRICISKKLPIGVDGADIGTMLCKPVLDYPCIILVFLVMWQNNYFCWDLSLVESLSRHLILKAQTSLYLFPFRPSKIFFESCVKKLEILKWIKPYGWKFCM